MPRNRNRNNEFIIETEDIIFQHNDKKKIILCSKFLCDTFYDMSKELNRNLECVNCMEKINCKDCCSVLSCGHIFHLGCFIRWNSKCSICER